MARLQLEVVEECCMARYKHIDTSPRFIAVDLERQLLPGTFEHALNYLIDHELDLDGFDVRYRNDATGACAYPPAMLLKVVLFAYSQGIVSSRGIERACREHVTFIALNSALVGYISLRDVVAGHRKALIVLVLLCAPDSQNPPPQGVRVRVPLPAP